MKNKFITLILLLVMLANIFISNASAEEAVNWYVKRCGNKQPALPEEHKITEKYNAYYIDKKYTDESPEKRIYLTFDAGYENGNVEKILNTLKEKNVPGAFFVLDNIILKNTDLILRMASEGHLVCNHTKNHKDMTTLTRDEITKNVCDLEKIYEEKTGLKMAKYFRFPEGRYNRESLAVIDELGYKTIFWSFGYADWDDKRQMDSEKAMKKILENTHNGAVILLHPTSSTNAKILPELIDTWRSMGYTFGTLDELTAT